MLRRLSLGASILVCLALTGRAFAQAGPSPSPAPTPAPAGNPGEDGSSAPAPGGTISTGNGGTVIIQPAPAGGTSYGPATRDPNADLPSSSRPRVGNETDSFDLGGSRGSSSVVYGGQGATGIIGARRPLEVPAIHVVRKGDTLWDLCDSYYANPWGWPKVWSYNPQIVNPHWIYPGDQLRMRDPNDPQSQRREQLAGA